MECISKMKNSDILLIAEIGANHDKELNQALELVDIAANAGWNYLKLQTYSANSLTMETDHPSARVQKIWGHQTLYQLYNAASMPFEFHEPIMLRAKEKGLYPITTVYDPEDLTFTENLNFETYKVASFELTYDDLLMEIAKTKKKLILSTGMASMHEIEHALEILSIYNAGEVTLLHCCSSYPAEFEDINLNSMISLKKNFGKKVGFSDHTLGSLAALTACAMGATTIEKHFTNNTERPGPDHRFSATEDILREIAEGVHKIKKLQGSYEKKCSESELINREKGRRSAFAIKNIERGTIITRDMFRFIRPGVGVQANDISSLVGKKTNKYIQKGHPILYSDLE